MELESLKNEGQDRYLSNLKKILKVYEQDKEKKYNFQPHILYKFKNVLSAIDQKNLKKLKEILTQLEQIIELPDKYSELRNLRDCIANEKINDCFTKENLEDL